MTIETKNTSGGELVFKQNGDNYVGQYYVQDGMPQLSLAQRRQKPVESRNHEESLRRYLSEGYQAHRT